MTEKRDIEVLADAYKNMNVIPMKVLYFDRVIETEKEMLEDDVYNEIFREFENSDKPFRQRNPSSEFTAYVADEKIYTAYTIDGIKMFREVTLGSCLSDAPFNQVVVSDDGALVIDRGWDKSKENRIKLKTLGFRVY